MAIDNVLASVAVKDLAIAERWKAIQRHEPDPVLELKHSFSRGGIAQTDL